MADHIVEARQMVIRVQAPRQAGDHLESTGEDGRPDRMSEQGPVAVVGPLHGKLCGGRDPDLAPGQHQAVVHNAAGDVHVRGHLRLYASPPGLRSHHEIDAVAPCQLGLPRVPFLAAEGLQEGLGEEGPSGPHKGSKAGTSIILVLSMQLPNAIGGYRADPGIGVDEGQQRLVDGTGPRAEIGD